MHWWSAHKRKEETPALPAEALPCCFTNKKKPTTTNYNNVIGSLCVESGFPLFLLGLELTSFFLPQFMVFILLYLLLTMSLKESWQPRVNSELTCYHLATTQCIQACRHSEDDLLRFKAIIGMQRKQDLSHSDFRTFTLAQPSLRFTENGP